jgi:hypothetical protein
MDKSFCFPPGGRRLFSKRSAFLLSMGQSQGNLVLGVPQRTVTLLGTWAYAGRAGLWMALFPGLRTLPACILAAA